MVQAFRIPALQPEKNTDVAELVHGALMQWTLVTPAYCSPLPLPCRNLLWQAPVARSVTLRPPSIEPVTSHELRQSNAVTCASSCPYDVRN